MTIGILGAPNISQGGDNQSLKTTYEKISGKSYRVGIQKLSSVGKKGNRQSNKKFTDKEDGLLARVGLNRTKSWAKLASEFFPDKQAEQVRNHWRKCLEPALMKSPQILNVTERYARFFKSYEFAVSQLEKIQVHPIFLTHLCEAKRFLRGVQATYQELLKKLITQEDFSKDVKEFNNAEKECERRTSASEIIRKHYCLYTTDQKTYERFLVQSNDFGDLYIKLLTGEIAMPSFGKEVILREKAYHHYRFKDLFDRVNNYFFDLSPKSRELLQESLNKVSEPVKLILEKEEGEGWEETIISIRELIPKLEEGIGGMTEIVDLLDTHNYSFEEIESIVIAGLKNEIAK